MLVHLADQLAGELDRLDLGAEHASEGPLDEAGDLALETSEDAHGLFRGRPDRPGGGSRPQPCYATPAALGPRPGDVQAGSEPVGPAGPPGGHARGPTGRTAARAAPGPRPTGLDRDAQTGPPPAKRAGPA